MSSLAQEESRSISENVTWGQRKRFADGKVSLPYKRFLGYRKGADGLPEVVPEEAETVRFIYKSFLDGQTTYTIAKILTENKIITPGGKENWSRSTIESILTNEKYKGSALLQKRYTVDFLTKKQKINDGEVPQYYVEKSHEAIISPDEFEQVQAEMIKRKKLGKKYSGNSIFSAKLICGDCGSFFGSKVWHSTSKYRRVIWQCNSKFKGEHFCTTPHFYEDEIKMRFLNAFSVFFQSRDLVLETSQQIIDELSDTTALDMKIEKITQEVDEITILTKEHVQSIRKQQSEEYDSIYDGLVKDYETKKDELHRLYRKRDERIKKIETIQNFIKQVSEISEPLDCFDESLWKTTVESVTVFHDNKMIFHFLDGTEVEG